MNDIAKRGLGYGLGTVVLAVLIYVGFVRESDADANTLLSSASVQLQLARSFPHKDGEGQPNAARAKLLGDIADLIQRARSQEPNLHAGYELEAHLSWAEGDYRKAAGLFRDAQASADATPETTVIDRLNEANMWRAAEDPEKSLEVLKNLTAFLETYSTAALVQQMLVLKQLERPEEALAIARKLVCSSANAQQLLAAGEVLESNNETESAADAYANAAAQSPVANYYLARLKIQSEEFDTGLDLLKRALGANLRQVGTWLAHDATAWTKVQDDQRFKDLISSASASAPGR